MIPYNRDVKYSGPYADAPSSVRMYHGGTRRFTVHPENGKAEGAVDYMKRAPLNNYNRFWLGCEDATEVRSKQKQGVNLIGRSTAPVKPTCNKEYQKYIIPNLGFKNQKCMCNI